MSDESPISPIVAGGIYRLFRGGEPTDQLSVMVMEPDGVRSEGFIFDPQQGWDTPRRDDPTMKQWELVLNPFELDHSICAIGLQVEELFSKVSGLETREKIRSAPVVAADDEFLALETRFDKLVERVALLEEENRSLRTELGES